MSPEPEVTPQICAVATAVPQTRYRQQDLGEAFAAGNAKIRRLYENSHIQFRHLILPEPLGTRQESVAELRTKHHDGALSMGVEAATNALASAGIQGSDVAMIVCVTTTGLLCPALSALLARRLDLPRSVRRLDIVGMGCSAALNALQNAAAFALANPWRHALVVAVEVCSAAYVVRDAMDTAVVNSLFGDGCAAVIVVASAEAKTTPRPRLIDFESLTLTDQIDGMRFELFDDRLSFVIRRDVPDVIGACCGEPVDTLLERHGLVRRDITHWILHAGGRKVIDAARKTLGLSEQDLRHTVDVLARYGNVSSAACLFALERLLLAGSPERGDYSLLMAMGPGLAIETALLQWW